MRNSKNKSVGNSGQAKMEIKRELNEYENMIENKTVMPLEEINVKVEIKEELYNESISENIYEVPENENNSVHEVKKEYSENIQNIIESESSITTDVYNPHEKSDQIIYQNEILKDFFHVQNNIEESKTERYNCKICKLSFQSQDSLECHLFVHESEKNYKCHTCNKDFSTKWILDKHNDYVHKMDINSVHTKHGTCGKIIDRKPGAKTPGLGTGKTGELYFPKNPGLRILVVLFKKGELEVHFLHFIQIF